MMRHLGFPRGALAQLLAPHHTITKPSATVAALSLPPSSQRTHLTRLCMNNDSMMMWNRRDAVTKITSTSSLFSTKRCSCCLGGVHLTTTARRAYCASPSNDGAGHPTNRGGTNALGSFRTLQHHKNTDDEQQGGQDDAGNRDGGFGSHDAWFHLPFMPPFHTVNIIMLLILANITTYLLMRFGTDGVRDFMVEHFTLSHENAWRIYPLITHSFYQEHLLQLAIDVWLFLQFGRTMLGFLGGVRMAVFWAMTVLGGASIHLGRQYAQLYIGMDEVDVRGRAFGPNPFILGLVGVEGLIFRNMNFYQNPPIPFLVLTAFVMVIDVWRIFTTKPEEHGATTGGALVAYIFWALPTRRMGLDKLTAAV